MKYIISSMKEALSGLFAQMETRFDTALTSEGKDKCDQCAFKGKIEFRNVSSTYPTIQAGVSLTTQVSLFSLVRRWVSSESRVKGRAWLLIL